MQRRTRLLCVTALILFGAAARAQTLDSAEAALMNEHYEDDRGRFDFTGKKVGFFLNKQPWSKEEFFEELAARNKKKKKMASQFIYLTAKQIEASGGYDIFIFAGNGQQISRKEVEAHIEKLKAGEASK